MPSADRPFRTAAVVIALTLVMPLSAQAGFEWIPPVAGPDTGASAPTGTNTDAAAMPAIPAPVVGSVMPPLDILTPMPGEAPSDLRRARPPFADNDGTFASTPEPTQPGVMMAPPVGGGTLADAMPPSGLGQTPPRMAVVTRTHRDSPGMGERPLSAFWGSFFRTKNAPPTQADAGLGQPIPLSPNVAPVAGLDLRSAPDLKNHSFVIDGFGEEMPLSVAAAQLILSPYQVRIDPSVDPATPISWQGGRAWSEVLADALDPAGLTARVDGTVITILPASRLAPADLAPPVPMMALMDQGQGGGEVGFDPMGAAFPPRTGYPTYGLRTTDIAPDSFRDIPHPWEAPSSGMTGGVLASPMATASWQSVRRWNGNAGMGADALVADWSRQAGVDVSWQAASRPVLERPVSVEGTLIDAINAVLAQRSEQPVQAELFTNTPTGQPLLVVR